MNAAFSNTVSDSEQGASAGNSGLEQSPTHPQEIPKVQISLGVAAFPFSRARLFAGPELSIATPLPFHPGIAKALSLSRAYERTAIVRLSEEELHSTRRVLSRAAFLGGESVRLDPPASLDGQQALRPEVRELYLSALQSRSRVTVVELKQSASFLRKLLPTEISVAISTGMFASWPLGIVSAIRPVFSFPSRAEVHRLKAENGYLWEGLRKWFETTERTRQEERGIFLELDRDEQALSRASQLGERWKFGERERISRHRRWLVKNLPESFSFANTPAKKVTLSAFAIRREMSVHAVPTLTQLYPGAAVESSTIIGEASRGNVGSPMLAEIPDDRGVSLGFMLSQDIRSGSRLAALRLEESALRASFVHQGAEVEHVRLLDRSKQKELLENGAFAEEYTLAMTRSKLLSNQIAQIEAGGQSTPVGAMAMKEGGKIGIAIQAKIGRALSRIIPGLKRRAKQRRDEQVGAMRELARTEIQEIYRDLNMEREIVVDEQNALNGRLSEVNKELQFAPSTSPEISALKEKREALSIRKDVTELRFRRLWDRYLKFEALIQRPLESLSREERVVREAIEQVRVGKTKGLVSAEVLQAKQASNVADIEASRRARIRADVSSWSSMTGRKSFGAGFSAMLPASVETSGSEMFSSCQRIKSSGEMLVSLRKYARDATTFEAHNGLYKHLGDLEKWLREQAVPKALQSRILAKIAGEKVRLDEEANILSREYGRSRFRISAVGVYDRTPIVEARSPALLADRMSEKLQPIERTVRGRSSSVEGTLSPATSGLRGILRWRWFTRGGDAPSKKSISHFGKLAQEVQAEIKLQLRDDVISVFTSRAESARMTRQIAQEARKAEETWKAEVHALLRGESTEERLAESTEGLLLFLLQRTADGIVSRTGERFLQEAVTNLFSQDDFDSTGCKWGALTL